MHYRREIDGLRALAILPVIWTYAGLSFIDGGSVAVSRGFCRAHKFIGSYDKLPKCQYDDFKAFAHKYSNDLDYVIYTHTPDRHF